MGVYRRSGARMVTRRVGHAGFDALAELRLRLRRQRLMPEPHLGVCGLQLPNA
jgi:hypothetical protein